MDVNCPRCGVLLDLPAGICEGRHLQCPECGVKFTVDHGAAAIVAEKARPKAIVCDCELHSRSAVSFYQLSGADEWKNYAWRRWTARAIDFYLGFVFMGALFFCAGMFSGRTGVGLGFWEWIAQPQNVWCDYVITTLGAYFSSTIVYVLFGTTLGKKMCGLLVADENGGRMAGWGYLVRESRVLLFGEWLCIPLLTLIGLINQYHMVTSAGHASYDDKWSKRNFYSRPLRGKRGYDIFLLIFTIVFAGVVRQLVK